MVKSYGVLGRRNLELKVDPPNEDTVLVDPAGLPFIHNSDPCGAGGASEAIYNWLGMDQAVSFPEEVKQAIIWKEEMHPRCSTRSSRARLFF
eukprot:Skav229310  [mRNA]  locus=scaffold2942:317781:318056:- [translate_table: standard]